MKLRELVAALPTAHGAAGDIEIREVTNDSREVGPGDLYVAVRGIRADGHDFAAAAVAKGAAAIVVERELPGIAVPQILVRDGAEALGVLVAARFGDPAKAMTLVGITGTNGKTTTSYLVEAILAAAGAKVGVVGTVAYRWPGGQLDAPYTTPTPHALHGALAQMRAAGCTHVVMEVTSAALLLQRVAGMQFAVAAFSNLTQDHLDVHKTMEAYRDAKRLLFARYAAGGTAVVNVDDPEGDGMAAAGAGSLARVLTVSSENPADIRVAEQDSSVRGIVAVIETPRGQLEVAAKPLIGRYNVANVALAVGIGEALGVPHDAIARGLADLRGVPGRVERVPNAEGLDIFVDYAHTPDGLVNVLGALKPLAARRLICVFGCGGDRDPGKRPLMGAAVARGADLAFVTSDNPRTEDPRAILDQILPGVPKPFFVDPDRRTAIRAAIAEATPGDIVCIAGKGHEDYQIVGTTKHHFSDVEEAAAACELRPRWRPAQLATEAHGHATGDARISRIVIDSRIVAPGDCYVAVRGEAHDGHEFVGKALEAGAAAVLVEHAVDAPVRIEVGDARIALGEIARAHRHRWGDDGREGHKLVAITGSAGKTTTKDLTRAALSRSGATHAATGSLNNETGVPLTLLALRPFHAFAVIEMGMRGLGQIEYLTTIAEPDVAVVVNAGTAHLELLGSTDAIAQAKSEIWLGLHAGGTIVRPADDERLATWARQHRPHARTVTFGEAGADVALVGYAPTDGGGALELDLFGERRSLALQLVGKHAALDACAALAAAHAAGASIDDALAGIARARPPSMRGEIVLVAGRHIIVDCYNANPASMAAALRALVDRPSPTTKRLAVLGDMLELGRFAPDAHREIGTLARSLGVEVVALGEHAALLGDPVPDPAAAAERALANTRPGDWILLKASRGMRLERVLDAMKERA
ncbi:MAG TPA: UDP-N-acetylmuramoyl-L-alanyl-D-glutamate--2,6-diaminopimelate ligase [Kofleriaceae bacterium]